MNSVKYDVLGVRFGISCWHPISDTEQGFYQSVGNLLGYPRLAFCGGNSETVACFTSQELNSTPRLATQAIVDAGHDVDRNASLVIIDFTYSHIMGGESLVDFDASIETHISNGVLELLSALDSSVKIVILMPAILAVGNAARIPLSPHLETGRLILIGDDGACTVENFLGSRYKEDLQRLRGRLLTVFQSKLVEHRGWFRSRHESESHHYARIYFDAQYAQRELRYLLRGQIRRVGPNDEMCEAVLFSSGSSRWLSEPLIRAAEDLGIQRVYDVDSQEDRARAESARRRRKTALVVSYLDSGRAAAEIIREYASSTKYEIVTIIAVIATGGIHDGGVRQIEVAINGQFQRFDVHYLVGKAQEYVERDDASCLVDRYDLSPSGIPHVAQGRLSPFEFWELVQRPGVGTVKESTPPSHRERFTQVPNLTAIVDRYGKWLAHRLWTMIRGTTAPSSYIFVHPDEPISAGLALRIQSLLGARTVAIPRDILDDLCRSEDEEEKTELINLAWEMSSPWSDCLHGASQSARVFILDDFRGSGRTEGALLRLLDYGKPSTRVRFQIQGACYLLDFSPPNGDNPLSRVSLYGWPWHRGQVQGGKG